MRRLHPIWIVIGFRRRANAPEGQKRFPISFLTAFALSAGLVLFPARAKAQYVATELAVLAESTTRVVRAVNGSTEVVGGARLGSGRIQGFLLDSRAVPVGSISGMDLLQNDSSSRLRSPAPALPIEGFPGSDYSIAYDINEFGDIAGAANTLLPHRELFGPGEILPTLSSNHFPATPVAEPLALALAHR